MSLVSLGFTARLQALAAAHPESNPESSTPFAARVVRQDRGSFQIDGGAGEQRAIVAGRLHDEVAVGDFVLCDGAGDLARIVAVLERSGVLRRRAAGSEARAQVIAAHVDQVLVVEPLDRAPNLRRLERGVTLAWDAGARPIVVLTKADLDPHLADTVLRVRDTLIGVDVHAVSVQGGAGLAALLAVLPATSTSVLIGASGAGKSSLVNAWLGAHEIATAAVRDADRKGRHTTTRRELFALPGGALVIDTPGTRELGLLGDEDALRAGFADVEELAAGCRFRDCGHRAEPGCAVADAVARGELDARRLESFHKQQRELRSLEERHAPTDHEKRAREKRFARLVKEHKALRRE